MDFERVSKRLKQWDQDRKQIVHLMPGYFEEERSPITLNLLGSSTINSPSSSSSCGLESNIESESIEGDMLDLGQAQCLLPDKCLDLKTREVYYHNSGGSALSKAISTEGEDERVDLQLNLSTSNSVNCSNDSSENNSVAEEGASMRLVGCLSCLAYYMVCRRDGSCPKCKGSSLLDFLGRGL